MNTDPVDPWLRTVSLLGEDMHDAARCASKKFVLPAVNGSVRLIERPTPITAIVAWSDPTAGCYGDQLWRMGVAHRNSHCALSGEPIVQRDAVYKPCGRSGPPNATAMILASVVHNAIAV